MQLLIKGSPNEDTHWGRFFVVTLDENAMADIRFRAALFRNAHAKDSALVEMAYQSNVDVYEGGLEIARLSEDEPRARVPRSIGLDPSGVGEIVDAEDLMEGQSEWVSLSKRDRVTEESEPCQLGYACMQVGSMGVFWEAGDPEGPTESQTFPITVEDLERLYSVRK